ncbi:MAG: GDSL-type esterase/lipase family protein [Vicinamibacterales bacterium]
MHVRRTAARSLIVLCLLTAGASASYAQAVDPDPARLVEEIKAFDQWDSKNTPPAHAVLFAGSSTIRMWATGSRFPTLTVINRGFGGSQISDVNYFVEQTVTRYSPDVVVFYAGDNDIAAGKTPERVLADYQQFVGRVLAAKPATEIIFIAVKPSLARWTMWPAMQDANARVKTYTATRKNLHYIDLAAAMLGRDGTPRPELFVADGLHMTAEGYDLWTAQLAPLITQVRPVMRVVR